MKSCTKCNQNKPLEEFKTDKRRQTGKAEICKPCSRSRCLEWRKENLVHIQLYESSEKRKEKEKIRERKRKLFKQFVDPEKHRIYNKLWEKANPEKLRTNWRNKRARKRAAEGKHSFKDIDKLIILQKNRCAYCKKTFLKTKRHVDHIIPLARGGSNWPHNLQLLCQLCNLKKHDHDPISFVQELGMLI